MVNGIQRGNWYDWERPFYKIVIGDETISRVEIIQLNIFQRILRYLFGGYKTTHFARQYKLAHEIPIIQTVMLQIEQIAKLHFNQLFSDTQLCLAATEEDAKDELIRPWNMPFVCKKGTFSHLASYSSNHAAFYKEPQSSHGFGAICNGEKNLLSGASAAYQMSRYSVALARLKPAIPFDSPAEEVKRHLLELAQECKRAKLDVDAQWLAEENRPPKTDLVLYETIINPESGQRRLVGFNIGMNAVLLYQSKDKVFKSLYCAHLKCVDLKDRCIWGTAFIPENNTNENNFLLANDTDIKTFDITLDKTDFIIICSNGLLGAFKFDHQKDLLEELDQARLSLESEENKQNALEKIHGIEEAILDAKIKKLNSAHLIDAEVYEDNSVAIPEQLTPLTIMQELFNYAQDNVKVYEELKRDDVVIQVVY